MTTVRDYRLSLDVPPVAPVVRDYQLQLGGAGVVIPRVRDYRLDLSGAAAVILMALAPRTVEPGLPVTLTATLVTAGPADSYTWRRISGDPVGIVGTGATATFTAPHQSAPTTPGAWRSSEVVIGVTATKGGTVSAERTCVLTILPTPLFTRVHGRGWVGARAG